MRRSKKKRVAKPKVVGKTVIPNSLLKAAKANNGIAVKRVKRSDGSYRLEFAVKTSSKQNGRSRKKSDQKKTALKPGLRLSRNGNLYYESRRNRSDKDFKDKL